MFCMGCLIELNSYGQECFYSMKVSKDSSYQKQASSSSYAALKTNYAYDAIIVPNISYERYVGNGFSVGATYWYTWWNSSQAKNVRHTFWRSYGGEIAVRKYFGKLAKDKPLAGHHYGLFLQGYMYDHSPKGDIGHMSDFTYDVGLDYGYSFPIDKRLNLDVGLGMGYSGGKYKKYKQIDNHYVLQARKMRKYFGPLKFEISFAYQLGKHNVNTGF